MSNADVKIVLEARRRGIPLSAKDGDEFRREIESLCAKDVNRAEPPLTGRVDPRVDRLTNEARFGCSGCGG